MSDAATKPVLLDARGNPIERTPPVLRTTEGAQWLSTIGRLGDAPTSRALDPIGNHAWIYAAVTAIATNLTQAPFRVMRETGSAQAARALAAKSAGMKGWTNPAGASRRACLRYLAQKSRRFGVAIKGAEPFDDHPLVDVLLRPNPYTTGLQHWQGTIMWLMTRGEAFWIPFNASMAPIGPNEQPTYLYLAHPDCMRVRTSGNQMIGWEYRADSSSAMGASYQTYFLQQWQVIQFKFFNPKNPYRGLSPMNAVASGIELDMMANRHERSVMKNAGNPSGFIAEKGERPAFMDDKERQAFKTQIEEMYGGVENAGKIGILPFGLEWVRTALSPDDMQFADRRKWTREEILAVYHVPKSIVSVTEDLNYATQQSQDFNFWDKCLIPIARLCEDTIDGTLLYPLTDDTFAAFDLTAIEGLRTGLAEKINSVDRLTGANIHMPPRQAFQVVGVDVEEYEGDEDVLVSPVLAPVRSLLDGSLAAPADPTPSPSDPPPKDQPAYPAAIVRGERRENQKARYWSKIIADLQTPMELVYGRLFRAWVKRSRDEQLARYDREIRKIDRALSSVLRAGDDPASIADAVLLDLNDMKTWLRTGMRPGYVRTMENVYLFASEVDFAGVPVFQLDDPRLLDFIEAREKIVTGLTPRTIQAQARRAITEGFGNGETVQEVRERLGRVFDINSSSSKTLTWSRTEAGGFMNGARDVMFDAQGFKRSEWTTAGDEHVRESHVHYGNSGAHDNGFDYLTIRPTPNPHGGKLRHPNDSEAPADEVVNCRCVAIPVK